MDYTALYRKYRPRRFADLVGQEHVARTLLNAVSRQMTAHAYLSCGPRGTGKTSAAQIMSRALNCEQPQAGEPCGECEACRRILAGNSLDILEIDAASNRGIDEMRDLRERVKYAPAQEKYKVYIIDEVHMLTPEAFNALLKTLEEPPAHIVFILATTEPHKVPVTVLSRCQRFDFHRIGESAIREHLAAICRQESVEVEPEAIELLAARAQGGLRDAISLLDQCIVAAEDKLDLAVVTEVLGIVDAGFVADMARAVAECEPQTVVLGVETLVNEGRDLRQFLQQLLEYTRNQILLNLSGKAKAQITAARALQMLRDLVDGDQKLKTSLTPRLSLEIALLTACRLESGGRAPVADKTAKAATGSKAAASIPTLSKPVAEPAPEPIAASGQLSQEQWQAVLRQVKRHSVVCEAFLKMAVKAEIQGSELMVTFRPVNQIHQSGVEKPENKAKIEQALSELFGRLMKLRATTVAE